MAKEKNTNRDKPSMELLLLTILLSAAAVVLFGVLLGELRNPVGKVMTSIGERFTADEGYYDEPEDPESDSDRTETEKEQITTSVTDTTDAAPLTDETAESFGDDTTESVQTEKSTESTASVTTASATAASTTAVSAKPASTTAETTAPERIVPIPADDPDYFSDALFIGDSRTVGLYLYGKISGAKYFGKTSASVYNIFNNKASETGTGKDNLENYLINNKFGKIYILLGINEIGYSASSIAKKMKADIQKIMELQPGAKIIIESNMHVTQAKSDKNPKTFNNTRIDALNKKLAALADGESIFFIDFVGIFDDETGNMNPTYSRDGIHLKAKTYSIWKNWLLENGRV